MIWSYYGSFVALFIAIILVIRLYRQFKFFHILNQRSLSVQNRLRGYHPLLSLVRGMLYICAAVLIGAAFDRFWGTEQKIDNPAIRRDCIIAVDVSQSMRAEENGSSRLAIAKKKIADFMAHHGADRYGLYVFAGDAVMLTPLTTDQACVELFLADIDDGMIASSTTSLSALLRAVLAHDEQDQLLAHRTLLIVSDGEDFSEDLSKVIAQARSRKLKIITWAVGSIQGAPIPQIDDKGFVKGHLKTSDGTVVISRREDGPLSALAQATGGIHVIAMDHEDDIVKIVKQITPEESSMNDQKTEILSAWWMAPLAGLLIAIEWIISA